MRIRLSFVLDCSPDAAWRALRSPDVFRAVSQPFTTFSSLEPEGFPLEWTPGEHPVRGRAFGLLPMGDQVIDLSFHESPTERWVVDAGRGLSGPLALITSWNHTMTVSPASDGRTRYRDELQFGAGLLTPLFWVLFGVFWQWRGRRLRALAPSWG